MISSIANNTNFTNSIFLTQAKSSFFTLLSLMNQEQTNCIFVHQVSSNNLVILLLLRAQLLLIRMSKEMVVKCHEIIGYKAEKSPFSLTMICLNVEFE